MSCARHIESKTDIPDLGNEQNDLKTLFPRSGTAENDKNHRSRCRERPKMKKTAVPNVGNTQKHQKWLFPTLGSPKMRKTVVPKVGNTFFVSFTGHHDRKY